MNLVCDVTYPLGKTTTTTTQKARPGTLKDNGCYRNEWYQLDGGPLLFVHLHDIISADRSLCVKLSIAYLVKYVSLPLLDAITSLFFIRSFTENVLSET